MLQIIAIVASLAITAVGTVMFVRAISQILAVFRLGQPAYQRTNDPASRGKTLLIESLGHTRMLQWSWVGAGHWFIMTGFGLLFFTLVTAFGQLFDAGFTLPIVGKFFVYEWLTELFTWVMIIAIVAFLIYRLRRPTERVRGNDGRFFGSTMWQAYFVEAVILGVGLCIVTLRGLEYALFNAEGDSHGSAFNFPLTFWIGELFSGASVETLENAIYLVAMLKILISFTWMIVISANPTMGVAWHRFLAFFNIYFKRDADGRTALGAVRPIVIGGEKFTMEMVEDLDEEAAMGVGKVEDFTWKGLLDFTSCTECGRCQSQCPAWNTDKPLSPKLLITNLRDHAHAKAPFLLADEEGRKHLPQVALAEAERPLVGATEGDAWAPSGGAVIDDDVLWNCTSCGACVQQCPVDIEHVDHIIDMRRYQVLIESNFPAELNGLFKGLENKGNPWNMSSTARLEWADGLDFDVKVVGDDVETLDEVDWLFWVGCAGAYEDRAKKTTRAVAELLNIAGIDFAVLGNGETCTGDPARRAGNEFLFQQLATQNAEVLTEAKAKKVVSTCAHCFNTLKNEYADFGVELEVVHHTQLLNTLVREGKLTPVAPSGGPKRSITYHDPCYVGRHNKVYAPPRELLGSIPSVEFTEMERNSERSFCCGAGGARMWMEEKIGERINMNRTAEAVGTGADQIAVGCPFCRVMLSDGLTMMQSQGQAREEVEVLDVAQMLLASVKREEPETAPAALPAEDQAREAGSSPSNAEAAPAAQAVADAVDEGTEAPEPAAEPLVASAEETEEHVDQPAAVVSKLWESEDEQLTPEARAQLKAELRAELLLELKTEIEALKAAAGSAPAAAAAPAVAVAAAEPASAPDTGQPADGPGDAPTEPAKVVPAAQASSANDGDPEPEVTSEPAASTQSDAAEREPAKAEPAEEEPAEAESSSEETAAPAAQATIAATAEDSKSTITEDPDDPILIGSL